MKKFFNSLTFKVVATIIIIQTIVMVVAAIYYLSRFSAEIDKRIQTQIQTPGKLMNKGLFSFEALSRKGTMMEIVGSDLTEAMVIGFDRTVYYSVNPEDIGKNVAQLKRIDLKGFVGNPEDLIIKDNDETGQYIASISPIYSAAGKAPFLFVYIKISTQASEEQKNALKIIFVLGSLIAIIATTVVTSLLFNFLFLTNIGKLRRSADMVRAGKLGPETIAALPTTKDELGVFAQGFKEMVLEVKKSREGLEQEVSKRTQELSESQKQLVVKFAELEKLNSDLKSMNKLMVGRELKMVELKKEIEELKKKAGQT